MTRPEGAVTRVLASTKLAVALCLVLAAGGIAGSLLYQGNTAYAKPSPFNVFRSPLFLVPAGLLVVNILFCASRRIASFPSGSVRTWIFVGMHLGIVLVAAGMILDGAYGFLGTKYCYRGLAESSYFDWRENRDKVFPFRVEVVSTEVLFHPLNLRVGVMNPAGGKAGVFTVREGVAFDVRERGIRVVPRRFDVETKTLVLDAEVDGRRVSGLASTPTDFARIEGYAVYPESYHDPEPSGFIARVRFLPAEGSPVEKEIRTNRPASYRGLSFSIVDLGVDRFGNPYAGLQITREPGEPVFWAGALLFTLSLVARFLGRAPSGTGRAAESAPVATAAGCFAALVLAGIPSGALAFGTVIGGDRTWEGEVRVAEPVAVDNGAVLRIRPGTTVLLSGEDRNGDGCPDGSIRVSGTLLVEGERERPVRFARLDPGKAWEEIFLKDAKAVIRNAVFEGAGWGLHIHDGEVRVEHSVFRGNGGGARMRGSGAAFSRCTIAGNGVGLRFWDGGPSVVGSSIEGNGIGLFYREGAGGGRIRGSRISNREWDVKIGDWASGDLDASGNFWGPGPEPAGLRVGDFRERKEPGRIVFDPPLRSPPDPCGADLGEGR